MALPKTSAGRWTIAILETDTAYIGQSFDEGPDCLCSRCRKPILNYDIAVRCWQVLSDTSTGRAVTITREWCFHPFCLGMRGAPHILACEDIELWEVNCCPRCHAGTENLAHMMTDLQSVNGDALTVCCKLWDWFVTHDAVPPEFTLGWLCTKSPTFPQL